MSKLSFVLTLCLVVACGCGSAEDLKARNGETQENYDKTLKPLIETIAKAKSLTLYEGLPHQGWENSFKTEKATKKTVEHHGFSFYAEALAVKEDDVKKLAAALGDVASFKRYTSPKKCGGYHPDWLVEWKDGDNVYQALICFGCHEVRLYGPQMEVYTDFGESLRTALPSVLGAYRKNRPRDDVKK